VRPLLPPPEHSAATSHSHATPKAPTASADTGVQQQSSGCPWNASWAGVFRLELVGPRRPWHQATEARNTQRLAVLHAIGAAGSVAHMLNLFFGVPYIVADKETA
jgi:hypothetical protein